MNKQSCRNKNKHRIFKSQIEKLSEQCVLNEESLAPDKVTLETLYSGAILTDDPKTDSDNPNKAPGVKTVDKLALVFGIAISAVTMAMIYLSGAK